MNDLIGTSEDISWESLQENGIVILDNDGRWMYAFDLGRSAATRYMNKVEMALEEFAGLIDLAIKREFAKRGRRIGTAADWSSAGIGKIHTRILDDMLIFQLSMGLTGRTVHVPYKKGQWKKIVKSVEDFCDWADKQDLKILRELEATGSPVVDLHGVKNAEDLCLAYKHREKYEKMMGKKVDPSDVEDVAEFARVWWLMHG